MTYTPGQFVRRTRDGMRGQVVQDITPGQLTVRWGASTYVTPIYDPAVIEPVEAAPLRAVGHD